MQIIFPNEYFNFIEVQKTMSYKGPKMSPQYIVLQREVLVLNLPEECL